MFGLDRREKQRPGIVTSVVLLTQNFSQRRKVNINMTLERSPKGVTNLISKRKIKR